MPQYELLQVLTALFLGLLAAFVLCALWIRGNRPTTVTARALLTEAEDSIAFLFDDERMVDATPRAKALMQHSDARRTDWENFLALMSARFPNLRSNCNNLAEVGKKKILPRDGASGAIEAEYWNGLARMTLIHEDDLSGEVVDPLTAAAM